MSSLIRDLVLQRSGGETIVDFSVAYEDRYESLAAARNAKIQKYQSIFESLRAASKPAYLDAIVISLMDEDFQDHWERVLFFGSDHFFPLCEMEVLWGKGEPIAQSTIFGGLQNANGTKLGFVELRNLTCAIPLNASRHKKLIPYQKIHSISQIALVLGRNDRIQADKSSAMELRSLFKRTIFLILSPHQRSGNHIGFLNLYPNYFHSIEYGPRYTFLTS
ncbi:hypothetical protein TNIN_400521 [Trichonephila inaurata madagascariensis]|uniref:Uncharacterized protein n=1 Tax=Trichonephila inaurata madagascariensis TaxID=2747483 RepID=A0A8X6WZP9_9ARAC|nr:hypothetical protein TNIN_400521 [Trichonephila inaurata madagascariensis]